MKKLIKEYRELQCEFVGESNVVNITQESSDVLIYGKSIKDDFNGFLQFCIARKLEDLANELKIELLEG